MQRQKDGGIWRRRRFLPFRGRKTRKVAATGAEMKKVDPSPLVQEPSEYSAVETSTSKEADTFPVAEAGDIGLMKKIDPSYRSILRDSSRQSSRRSSSVRWKDDRYSNSISWSIISDPSDTPKETADIFGYFEYLKEERLRASFSSDVPGDTQSRIVDTSTQKSIRFVRNERMSETSLKSLAGSTTNLAVDAETETVGEMLASSLRQSTFGASIMDKIYSIGSFTSRYSVLPDSVSIQYSASARRQSSMAKWAQMYRYSEDRPKVDENSHLVAETAWGRAVERIIIPWVPSSTESLIVFLFVFSLFQTIPFGITRIKQGVWKQVYVQQKLANTILETFGIESSFDNLDGLRYAPDAENPSRKYVDWYFGFHLVAGVLWIIAASIQYYMTNEISKRAHRRFGYLASFFFSMHIIGSLAILYSDFVHHHTASKIILFQGVVQASLYFLGGIIAIKRGDIETHRDMLIKSYLISIEGSGTIRYTAWVYYVLGNLFFSPEARICFDTVQCQSQFVTASAASCVVPYLFRLQGMRLVTNYFNCLYLRTPEKAKDITSRASLREEITQNVDFYVKTLVCILLFASVDRPFFLTKDMGGKSWINWKNVFDSLDQNGTVLQWVAYTTYTYMLFRNRMHEIQRTLLMPRRNAVGRTALQTVNEVRDWATRHGLNDSALRDSAIPMQ